jgi:hypothetical protein
MNESYPIKIAEENGVSYIWDGIRRKYVVASPEELVRQNTLQFLIENCAYPKLAINVEKVLVSNSKKLRYDILVFKENVPWLLVECKRPEQAIHLDTFYQSLAYNMQLQVPYIMLTNGEQMLCYDLAAKTWLQDMPTW